MAIRGALFHGLFAIAAITPHQIYHQDQHFQEMIASFSVEQLHIPWTELVAHVEPFIKYHDLVSDQLISAFGIYSTGLFLLLSMRMSAAMNYQRDGHASYTALTAEVIKFSQKCQLYCTDKRVAVDLSLWSYSLARATELHLQVWIQPTHTQHLIRKGSKITLPHILNPPFKFCAHVFCFPMRW
jgi:hypothetical protein